MLNSTNETVLEIGTRTLRAFARTAGVSCLTTNKKPFGENLMFTLLQDNLLAWKNPNGENGLQVYVQVIARLLSNSVPPNAAHNVGSLIEKVIALYGNHLQPVLDDIFTAVLSRMHTTDDLTLKQVRSLLPLTRTTLPFLRFTETVRDSFWCLLD